MATMVRPAIFALDTDVAVLRPRRPLVAFALLLALPACGSTADSPAESPDAGADASAPPGDITPDEAPDAAPAEVPDASAVLAVGGTARVIAQSLNLRTGPGTSNAILLAMPCGTQVTVVGGPVSGWWNVKDGAQTGWSSGSYLVAEAKFQAPMCGGDGGGAPDASYAPSVADIFARAKLAVGYSYYWGHGSWRSDGTDPGSCSGTCPSCTHSGQYGADCSGFVAKVWQVPSPSPLETDLHPYSTYNFYNDTTHWSQVPRASIQPGDALVYNANGAGHIMLFESGSDPWGSIWTYEARGCATGIVHNLRVADSTYIAIRREGL
jgi:uncharacterized protein YraI